MILDLISVDLRYTHDRDWSVIVFLFTLSIIVITKTVFEVRFSDFTKLFINDKYLKIYRDNSQLNDWFNVLLFSVQVITFTFFTLIFLDYLEILNKNTFTSFVQVFTLFSFFIIAKYLIEKIIAVTFEIEEFINHFNLYKLSYRAFISLISFPMVVVFYFNNSFDKSIFYSLVIIILIFHVYSYLKTLRSFQNEITHHKFYFILYLCALEIAPYYFIYYWFINN